MAQERPKTLPALTGIRFVAAALVVLNHMVAAFRPGTLPGSGLGAVLSAVAGNGACVAVATFFLLSGFVLAHSYTSAGGALRGSWAGFYVARLARIYPAYLLGFLLAGLAFTWSDPGTGHATVGLGLATALLLQSWIPVLPAAWNAPGWTLGVEALFYLAFPLLVAPVARLSRHQAGALLALCWPLTLAAPVAYLALAPQGPLWLGVLYTNPLLRLPEFVAGMALARLYALRRRDQRAGRPLAGAALIGLLASLIISTHAPFALVHNGLLDPLCALLLYSLATSRGGVARVLATSPVVALGEASYGLYILHWPLWQWYTHLLGVPFMLPATQDAALLAHLLVYGVVAVAMSLFSLAVWEQPARRAIVRAWARRQGRERQHDPTRFPGDGPGRLLHPVDQAP